MANRPGMYVQFYTDGSVARQPEIRPVQKPAPRPKPRKKVRYVLYVQPVALAGILAAAVMLVMMTVGCIRLWQANRECRAMENYVNTLSWNNSMAAEKYEESLDLEGIRKKALALGMIPQEEGESMQIDVSAPEETVPGSFWQSIAVFLEKVS